MDSILKVFVDTIFICTTTGLVILRTARGGREIDAVRLQRELFARPRR